MSDRTIHDRIRRLKTRPALDGGALRYRASIRRCDGAVRAGGLAAAAMPASIESVRPLSIVGLGQPALGGNLAHARRIKVRNPEIAKSLVEAGVGLGLVTERALRTDLARGRFAVVPGFESPAALSVYLIRPAKASRAAQYFCSYLIEHRAEM